MSYTNSPPKYKNTLNPKLLPLFVTNDKGQVTERLSSHHHQHHHPHQLRPLEKEMEME